MSYKNIILLIAGIWAPRCTYAQNTARQSYDPDVCRSLFVSFVKDDMRNVSEWSLNWKELQEWSTGASIITSFEHVITRSSTRPLLRPAPTQCDGKKRFISVGDTTMTYGDFGTGNTVWDPPRPTERPMPWLPYGWFSTPSQTCKISPADCQTQWALFKDEFRDWNTTLAAVYPDPQLSFDSMQKNSSSMMNQTIDIENWVKIREYSKLRGFFSGCAQMQDLCLDHQDLFRNDMIFKKSKPRPEFKKECWVKGKRFVLHHWRSPSNFSRDICGGEGWGDIVHTLKDDMEIHTATIDSVVFGWYNQGGLYGASSQTIAESTMTGKWTLTSPSVYLAYDTISATGACVDGSTLSDGLLTLHPSELSSVVSIEPEDCTVWYASTTMERGPEATAISCKTEGGFSLRPFNLDDLQGPVPAKAFFSASGVYKDWRITNNMYHPVIVLPTQVTKLAPDFAECYPFIDRGGFHSKDEPKFEGVWDPPIALTPTVESSDDSPIITPIMEDSFSAFAGGIPLVTAIQRPTHNGPYVPTATRNVPIGAEYSSQDPGKIGEDAPLNGFDQDSSPSPGNAGETGPNVEPSTHMGTLVHGTSRTWIGTKDGKPSTKSASQDRFHETQRNPTVQTRDSAIISIPAPQSLDIQQLSQYSKTQRASGALFDGSDGNTVELGGVVPNESPGIWATKKKKSRGTSLKCNIGVGSVIYASALSLVAML